MYQDRFGFIWISENGLALYDGNQVKVFKDDPDNPDSLPGSVRDMCEDENGTLWLATSMGISKFNRGNQSFTSFRLVSGNAVVGAQKILDDSQYLWIDVSEGLYRFDKNSETFRSFARDTLNPKKGIKGLFSDYVFMDKSGDLWVGSSNAEKNASSISRFDKATETFVHYQYDPANPESFDGKNIICLMEDHLGTLWISTWGSGLYKLTDREKQKFKKYQYDASDPNSIMSNNLNVVYEDARNNIWVAGEYGFSRLNTRTSSFTNYHIPYYSQNHRWPNIITGIIEDRDGLLYMGSSDGVFVYDASKGTLRHFLHDLDNPESLSDNYISQILVDHAGQIWIVTGNSGISWINSYANTFKHLRKKPNVTDELNGQNIHRIYKDSKGNLWIGHFRNGLNRTTIDHGLASGKYDQYVFDADDPKSINGLSVCAIYEDRDGVLWVGTGSGVNSFNENTGDFTRYNHIPGDTSTVSAGRVEAVFEDSHGTFWVGSQEGLNIMDRNTGRFIRIQPKKDDPLYEEYGRALEFFEDSHHDLWIGGSFLGKLNREDTSLIYYLSPGQKNFYGGVWAIVEDENSDLWIAGGMEGLVHYIREADSFEYFNQDAGLPARYIADAEIDHQGNIWTSSVMGLSRFNRETRKFKNFNMSDGLLNNDIVYKGGFTDSDGWLYFGGRFGLTYFHPDSIKENNTIPAVYITALYVGGTQKHFDKALYEKSDIELSHLENDLSFDFITMNFIGAEKNQYAFMLEGYDEDWKYVGNRRTAYYTNLSPGTYTFRVKGSNNDGYWNEEGASLVVVIKPPFWKTWWAFSIYIIIAMILFFAIRRSEIRKIRLQQELELKETKAESLALLDAEKNKFFSNISHEFRTPLTLILGPLERVIEKLNREDNKTDLGMVRRNALRLQTLIDQLLSLSKLESGNLKIKARPENVVTLSRLLSDSFRSLAEERGIQLEFESDAEEYILYLDRLKFEKIINNMLSNAFKFTEAGGKIKVSVSADHRKGKEGVILKFADTGIGIRKERLQHVFDRFYQVDEQQKKSDLGTGIGLALTKELVELHHGKISVDSEFGMGTTFTVFLPLGKDHLVEDEIFEPATSEDEMDDEMLQSKDIFVPDAVSKTVGSETNAPLDDNRPLLLLVEDNADMRAYIKSYLVDTFQVLEASNGKEGAEMAIDHLPDLIVSDLMMPFMDGNEMTQQLKNDERTSHIPIILLTAKASAASKLEGLETGADDFLTKPFDAAELLVRVKNLIEQRQRLREMLSRHIGDDEQTHIIRETAGKAMSKLDEQFLAKTKQAIEKHMSDPDFSVESLAQELAMSRSQLHRKLKTLVDISASDLIRDIRLQKAAELLREGELNITQVTYEIGISSLSYFSKAFKEKYGVNPSDYN